MLIEPSIFLMPMTARTEPGIHATLALVKAEPGSNLTLVLARPKPGSGLLVPMLARPPHVPARLGRAQRPSRARPTRPGPTPRARLTQARGLPRVAWALGHPLARPTLGFAGRLLSRSEDRHLPRAHHQDPLAQSSPHRECLTRSSPHRQSLARSSPRREYLAQSSPRRGDLAQSWRVVGVVSFRARVVERALLSLESAPSIPRPIP